LGLKGKIDRKLNYKGSSKKIKSSIYNGEVEEAVEA